jgi:hypothetical protein
MSEEEQVKKLREVALSLMQNDPVYFGTFRVDVLMSWLEDREPDHRVLCTYCRTPLLEDSVDSFTGTADHLLPQAIYPQLGFDRANGNSVACCSRCNSLKGAWDPNTYGDPVYEDMRDKGRLNKNQRQMLIQRSRDYVRGKLEGRHVAWKHWVAACEALGQN